MSSSYAHEALRAVPPLDGQRRRFALLLQLKDAVHTARDLTLDSGVTAVRSAGPQAAEAGPATTGPKLPPDDLTVADINATGGPSAVPTEDEEPPAAPEPLNRAERRAQQRQQTRNRRTPRTT